LLILGHPNNTTVVGDSRTRQGKVSVHIWWRKGKNPWPFKNVCYQKKGYKLHQYFVPLNTSLYKTSISPRTQWPTNIGQCFIEIERNTHDLHLLYLLG